VLAELSMHAQRAALEIAYFEMRGRERMGERDARAIGRERDGAVRRCLRAAEDTQHLPVLEIEERDERAGPHEQAATIGERKHGAELATGGSMHSRRLETFRHQVSRIARHSRIQRSSWNSRKALLRLASPMRVARSRSASRQRKCSRISLALSPTKPFTPCS